MSWVRSLELRNLEARRAVVAPTSGRRDLVKFLTPQRREQLAAIFRQVLGRPIQVEILETTAPADAAPETPDVDHAKATSLPTVRKVMDHFNASVIEAHPAPAPDASGEPEQERKSDASQETPSNE